MKTSNDFGLKTLINDLFALGEISKLKKLRSDIKGNLREEELHIEDQKLINRIDFLTTKVVLS